MYIDAEHGMGEKEGVVDRSVDGRSGEGRMEGKLGEWVIGIYVV